MTEVVIRRYEAGDQPGIEWLFARTPPAGRTYVRPQPLAEDLKAIEANYDAFWVAVEPTVDGEAVVGMLGVCGLDAPVGVPEPDFVDRLVPSVRVHWVLVVPERQRRGIGRALISRMADWASEHRYAALVLETTTEQEAAVAFYRALGFDEIGRTTFRRWEQVWFELKL
jgi:GNAT superfamily N-acetyltransferase